MTSDSKIFVAGHRGLVGSAICRVLSSQGYTRLTVRTRDELDLRNQAGVEKFFAAEKPEYVFLAAAKVGGILANSTMPADFLRDNLQIQTNVIDSAWRAGVKKLEFLGSVCIYPKFAEQPIREESLLTGALEPTNEWYAVAKIAGLKMIQAYARQFGFNGIALMPSNLYGPGDNFHLQNSHVIPALLRKFHEAKVAGADQVTVWGSGTPRREFLHVDDMARAAIHLMERYDSPEIVNVGAGQDIEIRELARLIGEVVGFTGAIVFDASKPDGTPRRILATGKLTALGWKPRIALREGLELTYRWYLEHAASARSEETAAVG